MWQWAWAKSLALFLRDQDLCHLPDPLFQAIFQLSKLLKMLSAPAIAFEMVLTEPIYHIPQGKCSVPLIRCEKLVPSMADFKVQKAWYRHSPSEHLRRCSATEKCHNYICSWVLLQQCASKIISAVFLFITHQTLQRPRLLEGTTRTEAEQLFFAYYLGCWVPQIAGRKQVNCHLSVTCYQVLILWDIFGALTADPSNKNFEVFQEAEWG